MTEATFRIVPHIGRGSYVREFARSVVESDSHAQNVQIAFKQYIPLDNVQPSEGDVTIIAGHANGIPKECYEPLFVEVYRRAEQHGFNIRSIWMADYYNQGASGILNANILGNDPCWTDHARDLLIFINERRTEMPQPLVALGHSGGASQLVHLSLMHPSLFKALVFLECGWYPPNPGAIAASSTLQRRDIWPSKQAATESFQKSKFYQVWDRRCFKLFIRFGLMAASTEGEQDVTLTTAKHQELATLLRPNDDHFTNKPDPSNSKDKFHRPELEQLFRRLPEVRPPVLYLFGGQSGLWSARRDDIVRSTGTGPGGGGGVDAGQVEEGTVVAGTHFMPLEKVEECAEMVARFLGQQVFRWKEERAQLRDEWQNKPRVDQLMASKSIVEAFGKKPDNSNL